MPRKTTARKPAARLASTPTAVAYLRVSTAEQTNGPEAQRSQIEAWAARGGFTIAAWHVDHGVSGAAGIDARPALLDALVSMADVGASVLVVAKRDRLARDVTVATLIERECARMGATVETADGIGAGDSPEAALMRGMLDLMAAYELAMIKARTKAGLRAKARRGERTGGVPVGCRVAADGRTLEADPVEAEILAAVRELRAAGMSMRAIAAELARLGFATRKGGAIGHTQVARILDRLDAREAA